MLNKVIRRPPIRRLVCDQSEVNLPRDAAKKQFVQAQKRPLIARGPVQQTESNPPPLSEQAAVYGGKVGILDTPKAPHVYYINPSVIDLHGKRWIAARRYFFHYGPWWEYKNTISIFEYLGGNKVGPEIHLEYPKRHKNEQTDDPRLSVINGVLNLSICSWRTPDRPSKGEQVKPPIAHQTLAELGGRWNVTKFIDVDYQGNMPRFDEGRSMEKNWLWFELNNQRWCLYHAQPQTVLREEGGKFVEEHRIEQILHWKCGQIRGGTPPVRIGDEFITFFHSSVFWKMMQKIPRNRYFMGAITFEAKPPFRITRITRTPMLVGTYAEPYIHLSPSVVFPAGAILKDGKWFITYGINDCRSGWMEVDHSSIEQLLTPA